jgi:hypothetical protein
MSSEFADLARDRKLLEEFCKHHVPSLARFRSDPSFTLHVDDKLGPELRHLTTTTTCIESLLGCAPRQRPDYAMTLAEDFAKLALKRPPKKWKSEESAAIYCRCRTLPLVVRYLPRYQRSLQAHIKTILHQLEGTDRFGLGEADPERSQTFWYPPNAFHTYWFLRICEELETRFEIECAKLNSDFNLDRRKEEMLLWARSGAGRQISLHSANSSSLDSDQLAWSLAILTRFDPNIQSNLANQDFVREGFKSLFSKQTDAGYWQHGQPLFHYTLSGNAYCYVYETFTELLKAVLDREKQGEFLRSALRPFAKNLMDLWNYAEVTQIRLPAREKKSRDLKDIGWSSGHRIGADHPEAEGWATASVFAYAQALRRLIGVWTREEAVTGLNRVSAFLTAEAGQKIAERGDTWSYPGTAGVAQQLVTLFVNPTQTVEDHESLEPDNEPIRKTHARSAILFGPPGTSKTTLARAVAGAIGWQYIELHASHFVAGGLPSVQRTADEIFQRLMELDHTVVLFDEIDELVREREVEPDAFGRFLTTSMLPKLAELWDQRKVIYFVATNHIEYFDRAVTRAQRFDVLIFVTPPAYHRKLKRVEELIRAMRGGTEVKIELPIEQITQALSELDCTEHDKSFQDNKPEQKDTLPKEQILAKFILLRWDQLDELAFLLNQMLANTRSVLKISEEHVRNALTQISDSNLQMLKTYCDYRRAGKYAIGNYSKDTVWEVDNLASSGKYKPPLYASNDKVWLITLQPPDNLITNGFRFARTSVGHLYATMIKRKTKK